MYDTDTAGCDTICVLYIFDSVADEVGEFEGGELIAVAEIDGSCPACVHQCDQAVD
jgi:hypothetical protein